MSDSQQDSALPPLRPTYTEWAEHWRSTGQAWRTEPEITQERQEFLAARVRTVTDVLAGVYPFRGIELGRADLEWLLASLDGGPIDWMDVGQRSRIGLDLRGADLRKADVHGLPLACARLGLALPENLPFTLLADECYEAAAAKLENAYLRDTHLEGAILDNAHLEGAYLHSAHLEGASLRRAHLENALLTSASLVRATLTNAYLTTALLRDAHLEGADLRLAQLANATLRQAHLEGANLEGAHLGDAVLEGANLAGADLRLAQLANATLRYAHLEGANFEGSHLESADFEDAHLEGADLRLAQLANANLRQAHLEGKEFKPIEWESIRAWNPSVPSVLPGADMRGAILNVHTNLEKVTLGRRPMSSVVSPAVRVADVVWSDVNLSVVDWETLKELGDDRENLRYSSRQASVEALLGAIRANRQLKTVLYAQGLNDEADRFAYKAHLLDRHLLRLRRKYGLYAFSFLLGILAGYGYKPLRCLLAYLTTVVVFALLFLATSHTGINHLSWDESLVLSVSSFHGRGFLPQTIGLGDSIARLAALEAICGLAIEVSFIATFTQRFFGR